MRTAVTVGVAVLIILGLATTGVAQTTYYACVLKDGTIRMVPPDESCRKNETLISWTAGPSGGGGPTVWDSSPEPKQVGVFTASGVWGCPHSVMFKSGDTWFLADIATDGFVGQGPLTFYYMDMECTQGPYLYQYQATYLTKRIGAVQLSRNKAGPKSASPPSRPGRSPAVAPR